jgi:malate/lactate dehydrogenase
MKIKIYLFALMLTFTGMAINAQAATNLNKAQSEMRVAEISQRVDQIRAMDLSHMNRVERLSLKHELKGMNKELRQMDGVIYISAGALILIIVILILVL